MKKVLENQGLFLAEKERFSHSQSSFALLRLRLLPSRKRSPQAKSLPLLALASSSPGRASARPSLAGKPARGSNLSETEKKDTVRCPFFWRRRRDSNSRAGYPTYALSRGASSTCLSTSPYPADRSMSCQPYNYISGIAVCREYLSKNIPLDENL